MRYKELGAYQLWSVCVSGMWLVTLELCWSCTAHVYSLPGLQPESELSEVGSICPNIRGDNEGRVFVGCNDRVVILEISRTGNLTFSGNITAGGRLSQRLNFVAVGSTPGQLWVGYFRRFGNDNGGIYLIDINNDIVIQEI